MGQLVLRMERACQADSRAREKGQTASEKLKMINDVISMMNRSTAQDAVLDPDTGFLRAIKFFLEPLPDASLPAYDIQNKIFQSLERLPIGKDQLLGSELGKVVIYYSKSKQPTAQIKRTANKLAENWTSLILKRTADYKTRQIETAEYDFKCVHPTGPLRVLFLQLTNLTR